MNAASCLGLLGSALLLAACAQAAAPETGGGAVDASVRPSDATRPVADASFLDAPSDATGVVSCMSAATCMTSTSLGSISGDTGFTAQMASGYQSAWYNVRATEDNSSFLGKKMSISVSLTSPAGAMYDVFVYVNTGSDVLECTTPNGTPSTSGSTQTVEVSWGEGEFSNGKDDSRTVSIEVRPLGTTCSADAEWNLIVAGDS